MLLMNIVYKIHTKNWNDNSCGCLYGYYIRVYIESKVYGFNSSSQKGICKSEIFRAIR